MDINIMAIVLIVVIAGLCWYVNDKLNNIPMLKTVLGVLIVVAAILLLLQSLEIMHSNIHIQ